MDAAEQARFAELPAPPRAEDWIESVDVSRHTTDPDRELRETLGETLRATYLGGPV